MGNCDQRKWKGISEVAILLEDAHQSGNRGPSSALLGKVFSLRSCKSRVESGTAQLSALSCSVGPNAELQQCWTFAGIGTSLLLESFPHISVMVSKEQNICTFQFVTGKWAVIKMAINIIKHLFKRDELEASPLSKGAMKTMEKSCWRHLSNKRPYKFISSMSVFLPSW